MRNDDGTVLIEDAQLLRGSFMNFSGEERMYNRQGDRNFCVRLDEETAALMERDGWNVKYLKPREEDEGEVGSPYIKVTVGFKGRPPRVVMIGQTSGRRTELDEASVGLLDDIEMYTVDLMIRPYEWEVQGKTGITAYLKSIYVTIVEDYLELKYSGV